MGDTFNEGQSQERPVHTVTLGSFQMSKYEVTNGQYAQFLNAAKDQGLIKEVDGVIYASADSSNQQPWFSTSSASADAPDWGRCSQIARKTGTYCVASRAGEDQSNHPVVCVSWYGAKAFCDFYHFQLPTEAHWEYGARGGLAGRRFPWGDMITNSQANYHSSNSYSRYDTGPKRGWHPVYSKGTPPYTAPVGRFAANGYGLYDMAGNVWEWCADWWGELPAQDPTRPDEIVYASTHAARGGGWDSMADWCRVAFRGSCVSASRSQSFGFRVCRPLDTVTLPDLSAMPQAEAESDIIAIKLIPTPLRVCHKTIAEGHVINQTPTAGTFAEPGSELVLIVSKGPGPSEPEPDITWVAIDDPGVSGHEGFQGEMSRYETTNGQYARFLNTALATGDITVSGSEVKGAKGSNPGVDFVSRHYYELAGPGINYDNATQGGAARIKYIRGQFVVDDGFEAHPVTYVSWYGAMAFSEYYGWRLPTEWEWQAVADYDGSYTHGCGTTIDNSLANYQNTPHPHGTTAVGAFGTYGYGMADMAGNVSEWTRNFNGRPEGTVRFYRGGVWNGDAGLCRVEIHNLKHPANRDYAYGIGFRVCRSSGVVEQQGN